jgi:hypothetical protein
LKLPLQFIRKARNGFIKSGFRLIEHSEYLQTIWQSSF